MYHQTPLDPRIDLYATIWADQLVADLDQIGIPITAANNRVLLAHLSQNLFRIARQREQAALERLHRWVAEEDLLSAEDAIKRLHLTYKEFQRACRRSYIRPVTIPQDIQQELSVLHSSTLAWYSPAISLTTAQQEEVRNSNYNRSSL